MKTSQELRSRKMKTSQELLPGLPKEVALECLIRIPVGTLPGSSRVSTGWKAEIESPEFRNHRKSSGLSRSLIVLAQSWVDPNKNMSGMKNMPSPFYRLVVLEPETGEWSELPPIPEFPDGLPVLSRLAGVGSELVVIGGCEPVTWRVLDSVFIYNFVSGKWRRGAHMPGGQRLFFGCASDFDRMVYVAGGDDEDKNALKSALVYDVADNKWTCLPDMAVARDECTGLFHSGKFHIIGGYGTETQGRFARDSEAYDIVTSQWGPVDENFLKDATVPTSCAGSHDGKMYVCRNGNVMERDGTKWRVVEGLPVGVRYVDFLAAWKGKLFLIGYANFEEPHRAYVMDLGSHLWTKIEFSRHYTGHVQSGCYLEI